MVFSVETFFPKNIEAFDFTQIFLSLSNTCLPTNNTRLVLSIRDEIKLSGLDFICAYCCDCVGELSRMYEHCTQSVSIRSY